jgi:nucleotide-binding universal stress UspA family protein
LTWIKALEAKARPLLPEREGGTVALRDIRNILVGLTEEGEREEPSSALGYALSLAGEAGAHVSVEAASLKLGLTHGVVSSFASQIVAAENARTRSLATALADAARQEALQSGVVCTVQTPQLDYPALMVRLTQQARVHDLTVLDAEPVALALDRALIEALLIGSGRPIIVVPAGLRQFRGSRVIVAWDGSAKAARAMNDALPFLRAAEQVELVVVVGEKDLSSSIPGAEAAPHLARHGIDVEVVHVQAERADVAQTLRCRAVQGRADLLVMGAFVHSRIRQLMLGGTTQSLLRDSPVPLLLSH